MEEDIKRLLKGIEELYKQNISIKKELETFKQSPEQKPKPELYAALAKAQAEMDIASKNKTNPFFKSKYADLASVIQSSRPALTKNELAVYQALQTNDKSETFLHTVLTHSSGQCIESSMKINPPKADIQSICSYNTYVRRICYAGIVGVVTGDDDDGEMAVQKYRKG